MTSVCVGGVASQVKTGLPDSIYISPVFMASILPVQLEWLRPFLPYIPDIFLPLDPFCTGEPPAQPTLTDATIAAVFAGGDFSAALLAGNLIQAALLNWYWYQVCECSSGTQPTAPTPQSDPGGLPAVNPPALVSPPTAVACASFDGSGTPVRSGPQLALIGTGTQGSATGSVLVPAGATSVRLTCTRSNSDSSTTESHFEGYSNAGVFNFTIANIDQTTNTTVSQQKDLTGQESFKFYTVQLTGATQTSAIITVHVDFYCGGQNPGQTVQPCCPPDEILNGMVRQILTYVKTIQRQAVPFGYAPGAVHSGLSGQGSITIQGLIGATVDVTTLPSSYGRAGTSPTEYFDLGFISWGTPDGWPTSYRLSHDPLLMFPRSAGLYTQLDYDLAPGVVVDIGELVREP